MRRYILDGSLCAAPTGFATLLQLLQEVGRLQVDSSKTHVDSAYGSALAIGKSSSAVIVCCQFNFRHYTEAPFSVAYYLVTHQQESTRIETVNQALLIVAPLGVATILPVSKHIRTQKQYKAGTVVKHVNYTAGPTDRQQKHQYQP
jgi:hypothetical protein